MQQTVRALELNLTTETLVFTEINGPIRNRGLLMPDISLFGVTYLQQISETSSGAGLHVEPGIWVNVPPTSNPSEPASVARLASIPHGTVILAQGKTEFVEGGPPTIPANNIIPFPVGGTPPPNSDFGQAIERRVRRPRTLKAPATGRGSLDGITTVSHRRSAKNGIARSRAPPPRSSPETRAHEAGARIRGLAIRPGRELR